MKLKKILTLFITLIMVLSCFVSCGLNGKIISIDSSMGEENPSNTTQSTNEEMIRDRIELFLTSYNDGDMDSVLQCLNAKTRNAMQAMLNVLGGVANGVVNKYTGMGFGINLSDLFSLGVAMVEDDFMKLKITDINVIDQSNAVVTTTMDLTGGQGDQNMYFIMVYEKDGWYISDMTDKIPASIIGILNQTNENIIIPTSCDTFADGVAGISYTEGGTEYRGIINTHGKVIYTTDKSVEFTFIGKGATIVSQYNKDTYKYDLVYIIDNNGNTVATFDEKVQLLAYGDGYALVYQRKDTITAIKHMYGIMDCSGNWIQPMTDLGTYCGENHYIGNGVFAIAVWTGFYHNDYLFWNSIDGNIFYISGLQRRPEFVNNIAFVYETDYSQIINPFDISGETEDKGVYTPEYFLLYSNGTYKAYNMDGKKLKGYSNGYIWYTVDGDNNQVYIELIDSSSQNVFTYNEYSADMVNSITFNGDYGLVTIMGANYHLYFTLIDKTGKQKFEPIETTDFNSWSGTHSISYSDGAVVFKNTDGKYCIADNNGNVIVTDYDSIGTFSNGMAAVKSDGISSYINKSGEKAMQIVKNP